MGELITSISKEEIELKKKGKHLKMGLALGAGGARGLVHIGVLRILEKEGIRPDYIAGTSIGAVVAGAYAAGRSSDSIEDVFRQTDWKKMVDFTLPKSGLLEGKFVERRIRTLVRNSNFKDLRIPLQVVAYDMSLRKKTVFNKGDVTKAVCASLAIPGIFAPLKIGSHEYIDGGVSDPTPFDLLKEMGADVIIAVDLFSKERTVKGASFRSRGLYEDLKEKFVNVELKNAKLLLIPERWPSLIRRFLGWLFDKIFYPARVMRMITSGELPPIAKVLNETVNVLSNNLARERLKNASVDFKVLPVINSNLDWTDFDRVDDFIKIGEKAMRIHIPALKKKLGRE